MTPIDTKFSPAFVETCSVGIDFATWQVEDFKLNVDGT